MGCRLVERVRRHFPSGAISRPDDDVYRDLLPTELGYRHRKDSDPPLVRLCPTADSSTPPKTVDAFSGHC
jgi:hypothetical protein